MPETPTPLVFSASSSTTEGSVQSSFLTPSSNKNEDQEPAPVLLSESSNSNRQPAPVIPASSTFSSTDSAQKSAPQPASVFASSLPSRAQDVQIQAKKPSPTTTARGPSKAPVVSHPPSSKSTKLKQPSSKSSTYSTAAVANQTATAVRKETSILPSLSKPATATATATALVPSTPLKPKKPKILKAKKPAKKRHTVVVDTNKFDEIALEHFANVARRELEEENKKRAPRETQIARTVQVSRSQLLVPLYNEMENTEKTISEVLLQLQSDPGHCGTRDPHLLSLQILARKFLQQQQQHEANASPDISSVFGGCLQLTRNPSTQWIGWLYSDLVAHRLRLSPLEFCASIAHLHIGHAWLRHRPSLLARIIYKVGICVDDMVPSVPQDLALAKEQGLEQTVIERAYLGFFTGLDTLFKTKLEIAATVGLSLLRLIQLQDDSRGVVGIVAAEVQVVLVRLLARLEAIEFALPKETVPSALADTRVQSIFRRSLSQCQPEDERVPLFRIDNFSPSSSVCIVMAAPQTFTAIPQQSGLTWSQQGAQSILDHAADLMEGGQWDRAEQLLMDSEEGFVRSPTRALTLAAYWLARGFATARHIPSPDQFVQFLEPVLPVITQRERDMAAHAPSHHRRALTFYRRALAEAKLDAQRSPYNFVRFAYPLALALPPSSSATPALFRQMDIALVCLARLSTSPLERKTAILRRSNVLMLRAAAARLASPPRLTEAMAAYECIRGHSSTEMTAWASFVGLDANHSACRIEMGHLVLD